MSQTGAENGNRRTQRTVNLLLVSIAAQAGCLTVLIIFIALFVGLWLDNYFQTRPLFTLILMLGSVPVTLAAMYWLVRSMTSRMKPAQHPKSNLTQEEGSGGETT